MPEPSSPLTYAASGVDVEAGDRAVELMRAAVRKTHGPQVVTGAGGFAGLFDASELKGYRRPLLATSTDGVGTKVAIAQALDVHDTIGLDLVAMVVDDLVVCGAKPLTMTDYLVFGKVVPEKVATIVQGIARGCELAGAALVGGETAEHPGLLGPDEYDVAGAATGVVEADALLGPERVRPGDVLVAMPSSGLHSNGFSLVRGIVNRAGWELARVVPEFGRTLGDELLTPTTIYAAGVLDLVEAVEVHAVSHVTGGGLAANLARVLPAGLTATVERATWTPPPVFTVLAQLGEVPRDDLERTFNLGVGMVAVLPADAADAALARLASRGLPGWVLGRVATSDGDEPGAVQGSKGVDGGRVVTVGAHPRLANFPASSGVRHVSRMGGSMNRKWWVTGSSLLLAVLLALAGGAWYLVGRLPAKHRDERTARLQKQVDDAYRRGSAESTAARARLGAALRPVLGEPRFSSRQVICVGPRPGAADVRRQRCEHRPVLGLRRAELPFLDEELSCAGGLTFTCESPVTGVPLPGT